MPRRCVIREEKVIFSTKTTNKLSEHRLNFTPWPHPTWKRALLLGTLHEATRCELKPWAAPRAVLLVVTGNPGKFVPLQMCCWWPLAVGDVNTRNYSESLIQKWSKATENERYRNNEPSPDPCRRYFHIVSFISHLNASKCPLLPTPAPHPTQVPLAPPSETIPNLTRPGHHGPPPAMLPQPLEKSLDLSSGPHVSPRVCLFHYSQSELYK